MNRKQRRADSAAAPAIPSMEARLYASALHHHHAGNAAAAHPLLQQILATKPRDLESLNLLAVIALENFDFASAETHFRKAIRIAPNSPESHCGFANLLVKQGKPEEALISARRALSLDPKLIESHLTLGYAYIALHQHDLAIASFRTAIALNPQHRDAHFNLAIALLATGDFAAGWPEYEWRFRVPVAQRLNLTQPQWRGEPACGKTLFIHAEQGFGDSLQFCRYAPLAAAAGLKIVLAVPAPLTRLMRSLPSISHIIAQGEPRPEFDLHCPMLSLPLAFNTDLHSIPGEIPYLRANPTQAAHWQSRLPAQGRRIGLAWAGNPRKGAHNMVMFTDRLRSIDPTLLAPLFTTPGTSFYSLQKDGPAFPPEFPIADFMPEMQDFADTAALIANLDLVISVDTSVAHLAAALGKPVWLLDRFTPCWRWLCGRSDSPWYPNMKIYRQPAPGDWHAVIKNMTSDLEEWR